MLLSYDKIVKLLEDEGENGLFIDPLLSLEQIGAVSVDIRLGYDFLVSVNTRTPFISTSGISETRSIASYFQSTRRDVGDSFLLYPGQLVITTSLEYVRLPRDVYADILTRSSYNRLGIRVSTMLQPGFRGCISLEIVNDSNNAIELIVGSRMFQMRLHKLDEALDYGDHNTRKYYGNVNPSPSKANEDKDIKILRLLRKK